MNHMGNEFFFEGHRGGQAAWRIHKDPDLHLKEFGAFPKVEISFRNNPGPMVTLPCSTSSAFLLPLV